MIPYLYMVLEKPWQQTVLISLIVKRSGYSPMTGRILLQAIPLALNDFHIGFTSMVGAQATKG